jgi:ribosomal protein S18 acetylase RimI-like enzyme
MHDSYRINNALPEDAGEIVAVIAGALEADILDKTLYSSSGITRYIRELIAACTLGGESAFLVARRGVTIAGVADLRRTPDALFLNYLAVRADHRSQGIAAGLLSYALRKLEPALPKMRLDVFESNVQARRWYERLGFVVEQATEWWRLPLPQPGDSCEAVLTDYPQSQASQQAFGFSRLGVRTPRGSYSVGRLGEKWWRVDSAAALEDNQLLSLLARLDPRREMLALIPVDKLPAACQKMASFVARGYRMSGERQILLASLRDGRTLHAGVANSSVQELAGDASRI